jgi:hypothetical protein
MTTEAKDLAVSSKQITFYEVPLVCPAAPEIGCGSRSKPILLQLEQERTVSEAWLNRPGTTIAIVWKPEATREEQKATFESVSKNEKLKARELKGAARKKALKDFAGRSGWHRGGDVDRLSEEEAGIIAARLVKRIQSKVSVSEEKAQAIQAEFTEIFKRQFTGAPTDDKKTTEERLLTVLSSQLDEKDVALLKETLPRSLRPLPGEK